MTARCNHTFCRQCLAGYCRRQREEEAQRKKEDELRNVRRSSRASKPKPIYCPSCSKDDMWDLASEFEKDGSFDNIQVNRVLEAAINSIKSEHGGQ